MSQTKRIIAQRWKSALAFSGALFLLPLLAGAAQTTAAPAHGALELTSALGRQLYALPDDQALLDARASLAADPKNAALILKLSKAQAARRQYKEAVATTTAGLASAPNDPDLYLERGHRERFDGARRACGGDARRSP